MKDRLLTLTLALAAFALFYSLMAPKGSAPQEKPTRPVSTEKGPNGYLAMLRWFEAEGLRPLSLRDRFTQLRQLEAVPPTGNLLISTAPHLYPVRDSEVAALRDWISEGNTLLVAAGLSDTPDWSMGSGNEFLAHMQAMTGLTFRQTVAASEVTSQEDQAAQADDMADDVDARAESEEEQQAKPNAVQGINLVRKLDPPLRFEMVPNGSHPLLADVKSVAAQSEYPTAQWRGSSALIDLVLELAQDPQSGEPMLWLLRYGNGQIIVSAYGSVFTNKMLGQSDNARLLANIVRWSRGPQGRVIIDDAHQGLVAFYDPEAFFGDKRLHASLWWLVGLWLVFVLGPQRLRATGSRWSPVDITSFVRASGGFMARVLKPATAGQQLFSNFFNDIRRQTGLPENGAPVWDWIAARAAIPQRELEQLQALHGRVLHGRRIDLPELQNLLAHTRHALS